VSAGKPHEVLPGVFALGSEWVNWYLVADGGALTAVDAGLPGFGKTLEQDLRALGFAPADVRALVLTHSDSDHTGLAPRFQEAGAQVWIHAADEDTLRRPRPKGGDASPVHLLPYLRRATPWRLLGHLMRLGAGRPPKVEGARTFAHGDVLEVPGSPRVIHTPGHTPGHCALHFERQGALFVGDAMCSWNPLTGRRGPQVMPSALNVSTEQCFGSLDTIERVEAEVVLAGHGEPMHERPAGAVAQARAAGRS
jgi:glyoxylase-like metal-dependent hydrolase (beta-lactamase superfamily II)